MSLSYSEYDNFVSSNIDKVDVSIQKDFLTRLTNKPATTTKTKVCLYFAQNIVNKTGSALFKQTPFNEYKLVRFAYNDKKIISYSIDTYYSYE